MRSVVCWLWAGRGYRPEHVNVLHRMFRRHLPGEFRFICITDEEGEFEAGIQAMPTPAEALKLADLQSPEGVRFPSCYRRLWMFSDEARCLGDRVLAVDIDVLVLGDASSLFAPTADFVGWRPKQTWGHSAERVGGGVYLLTPGSRTEVWTDFLGAESIAEARSAGYRGSDQAWMSYKLRGCEVFPGGIYSIRDLRNGLLPPPPNAVLVQHNGQTKPWNSPVSWVRKAWR